MKHFKVVGPETTREFDIEDDEMIAWNVIRIEAYEKDALAGSHQPMKNEKIYPTKDSDLKC